MRAKRWIVFALGSIAFVAALVWAVGSWLESPAGRARLETAVSDALNLPVQLNGEFNISFWPSLGVSGSDLVIGGADAGQAVATADNGGESLMRCRSYHVAVALWPLLQGRLVVLAVRAADGEFNPWRFGSESNASPGNDPRSGALPRIDLLRLDDFRIPMPGSWDAGLLLHHLEIEGFQAETDTPLSLELAYEPPGNSPIELSLVSSFNLDRRLEALDLVILGLDAAWSDWVVRGVTGTASWSRARNDLELRLEGAVPGMGPGIVTLRGSTESREGQLGVLLNSARQSETVAAQTTFAIEAGGIRLPEVFIESMEQRIRGHGCLRSGDEPSLRLDLQAGSIDLDRLRSWLPEASGAGPRNGMEPGSFEPPIDLRIRLSVDELRSGAMLAERVHVGTGDEPDCGGTAD